MAAPLTLLLILFILLVAGLQVWPKPSRQARHPTTPRLPRPRTPDNCPLCRQPHHPVPPPSPLRTPVKPWSERKSHRGAHKHASTAGYACPNPNCLYEGIPDPEVHALVGYGRHGQQERIQDFRCQACGTKFTVRRNIPLYRLKTASHRVAEVLSAMAEGLDLGAAARVFGHGEGTLRTWLTRAGLQTDGLHRRTLHDVVSTGLTRMPSIKWARCRDY